MSKIFTVVGATGNQGNSVAKYVLQDAQLSKEFKVRALSRDITKPAAIELQKLGAEIVYGDLDQPSSIEKAFHGAHTIFAITATTYDEQKTERELRQGKLMADKAVEAGAKYLIFSTLPSIKQISSGKIKLGEHFDNKFEVEQYIRSLHIKSSFFAPACFMENFTSVFRPQPTMGETGMYVIASMIAPTAQVPFIDVEDDAGKYVGAILKKPDTLAGKVLCSASQILTMEQVAQVIGKATGKTVIYNQLDENTMRGYLGPMADDLVDMFHYFNEFGYYGPDTAKLVRETQEDVGEKLTSLEDYFKAHPLQLL